MAAQYPANDGTECKFSKCLYFVILYYYYLSVNPSAMPKNSTSSRMNYPCNKYKLLLINCLIK